MSVIKIAPNVLQAGVRFLLIPDTTFEQPCAKNGACLLLAGRSRRAVCCPFLLSLASSFFFRDSVVRGRTKNVYEKNVEAKFGLFLIYQTKVQIVRLISK
jgi:hypothetical protein